MILKKNKLKDVLLTTAGIFLLGGAVQAQLTVDGSVNAQDGVQNVLMGGGVVASNITFMYQEATQIGTFECNSCGLGLASGLILATGNITGAIGPNASGSFSVGPPSGIDGMGDPDLAVLAVNTINNAAILEFDFVPTGDEIAFNFVFGSDEYPEFVNSINDAFGFFISGPGISGPFTNNAANIALIPNSTDPVTINTVNDDVNSNYYISNNAPAIHNVQADGFTTVLTAFAEVLCGETYHIKIAIGDASDGAYDSWVFLEEGSFSSSPLELGFIQPTLAPEISTGMYENCGTAPLTFYRPPCVDGDYSFDIAYSGTVINGVDIETLPTTVTIPDGEDSFVLTLNPLADSEEEGIENLVFFTQMTLADGEVVDIEFELFVYDPPGLTAAITANDNNVCPDIPVNLQVNAENVVGGISYLWSSNETTQGITVSSPETATYNVTVTDGCGYTATTEHTVDVLSQLSPLRVPESVYRICTGIGTGAIIFGGFHPLTINFDDDVLDLVDGNGFYSNSTGALTDITVIDACGNTTTFTALVEPCDTEIPNIFTPNKDESNPRFRIYGVEAFPNSSLQVFNRWGNLIFESNNYKNEWSGIDEEEGTYFYIFKRSDGKEYTGYVLIAR